MAPVAEPVAAEPDWQQFTPDEEHPRRAAWWLAAVLLLLSAAAAAGYWFAGPETAGGDRGLTP